MKFSDRQVIIIVFGTTESCIKRFRQEQKTIS